MRALCVDDEILLLNALTYAVSQSPDITEVVSFQEESEALAWAGENRADIAFLDIRLHDMTGLELAEKLREIDPKIPIVFCTGHTEYALDAFGVHANGFLTKPITASAVQREMEHLFGTAGTLPFLTVSLDRNMVFGRNGALLSFKRKKTQELFSVLLEQNGRAMTAQELCNRLWNDNDTMFEKNKNYLFQLLGDLRTALAAVDATEVLLRTDRG
ncbi:MAG: response regulator, partial [Ruminococcus sp.]|nr:response regulator [Candidatus Apopatosoma intestinale]